MMDPISIALGLASFAPNILKFFGVGDKSIQVANQVISIANTITGKSSGQESLEALKLDPKLAYDFNLEVIKNDSYLENLYIQDRQDARKRDTSFRTAGRYNFRADILAFLAVTGLVLCVYFVARDVDLPERAVNAIMIIAGVLASAVRDVYGFEFGSSKGHAEANSTLAEMFKRKG